MDAPGNADETPIHNLEFVSMNVASETEKERNRQVIRSTAMKSFHRKQLLQRSLEDRTVDRGSHSRAKRVSRSKDVILSRGSSCYGSFDRSSPEGSSPGGSSPDEAGPDGSSPEGSISTQSLSANSPASLLGAGRVDPFRIQPVDIGSRVDELLDHCKLAIVLERFARLSN